ncbi:NBR1-Ig-like domain-containing protein [Faucicola boevrei]|uniref:NBR1-Ig-like domain-containing protein n=1 Tax=Faucicola boevrei TaxID=346665 RepID=UPI000372AE62|nr:NBR1-Ig-like domain-containing protein [Moraxella boevrei]
MKSTFESLPKNDSPAMDNVFLNYLRQYCNQHNLTFIEFCKKVGIRRSTMYDLIAVNSNPKIGYFIQLGEAMGVHPLVLLNLKWSMLSFHTKSEQVESFNKQLNDASAFIGETIPDGTIMPAGAKFSKTWTIQNVGKTTWEGRKLVYQNAPMQNQYPNSTLLEEHQLIVVEKSINIVKTLPQQTVTLEAVCIAPKIAGHYIAYWKMVDNHGKLCFPDGVGLSLSIIVRTAQVAY